jgi:hypothetical protein
MGNAQVWQDGSNLPEKAKARVETRAFPSPH